MFHLMIPSQMVEKSANVAALKSTPNPAGPFTAIDHGLTLESFFGCWSHVNW